MREIRIWELLLLIIQVINFRMCRYLYMIISNITWRKYKYSTILQLIYLRICRYIYMIISNITWRNYIVQYYS